LTVKLLIIRFYFCQVLCVRTIIVLQGEVEYRNTSTPSRLTRARFIQIDWDFTDALLKAYCLVFMDHRVESSSVFTARFTIVQSAVLRSHQRWVI